MLPMALLCSLLSVSAQGVELPALQEPYVVGMLGDCDGDGASDYAVAGVDESSRVLGCRGPWGGRAAVRVLSSRDDRCLASFDVDVDAPQRFFPGLSMIGDLDGDGRRDLIVRSEGGARNGGAFVSTRDGRRLGGLAEGAHFLGCVGDVDGDGLDDLLAWRENGRGPRLPWEVVTARAVIPIWPGCADDDGWHWVGMDLDGDGLRELVRSWWGTRDQVRVLDSRTQIVRAVLSQATCGWLPEFEYQDVASLGLDANGDNEHLVLLCRTGAEGEEDLGCALLSGATLRATASVVLRIGDPSSSYHGALEFRVACVGDLDGDDARDVVLALPSEPFFGPSAVVALSGCDLHGIWRRDDLFEEWHVAQDKGVSWGERLSRAADLVPDRDGDGVPDVLCSDLDSGLFVLSGRTGALLKRFDP